MSQAMLSRFENQLAGLSDDILDRAAAAEHTFPDPFSFSQIRFSARRSADPMWRRRLASQAAKWIRWSPTKLRLMHLRRRLQAVEVDASFQVPNLPFDQYNDAERIAGLVRAQWQMPAGPVRDLTRAIEAAGVVVVHSALGGSAVDGVTFRAPGLPPFVLNVEQSADRMRFTLAHELGHLVMHHDQPTQTMEQEANEFASAFLMPTRDIRPYFARRIDLRLLAELKPVWRVSMASLLMRARSLGLLAYNQERYIWQQFSIAKIRQSEPPELDFAPEAATVLPDLLNAHIQELGYSIADLASLLHVQPPELASLYGLTVTQDTRPQHLRIVK